MGLFGSGGGTLGLGGTKYDPTTWGGTTGDVAGGLQEAYESITGAQGGSIADISSIAEGLVVGSTINEDAQEWGGVSPTDAGTWLDARQGSNLGVPIIYGTRRTGGHIIYQAMSTNENMLYVVYALAEGVQQSWTMYIDNGDGVMVDFDSSRYKSATVEIQNTNTGNKKTSGAIQHLYRNNISTGTSAGLVTNAGNFLYGLGSLWSTAHNCKGVAIEGLAFLYDNVRQFGDATHVGRGNNYFETEAFYRNGIPKIEFEMTGIALLDNTGATVSNSSDPAWILFNYLTNEDYGCGIDDALINSASFTTASTICNVENN